VVEPYAAAIIGIGASVVYYFSSKFLKKCGVDDVVDAAPVHFFCGAYGLVMASLFATKENYAKAYGANYDGQDTQCAGLFYGGDGSQFTANVTFIVFVTVWVGVTTLVLFGVLRLFGLLRVSDEVEEDGMDSSEHGAPKARGGGRSEGAGL
jgi:Amt family ammonium transporter